MRTFLFLVLSVCFHVTTHACINEYGTKPDGSSGYEHGASTIGYLYSAKAETPQAKLRNYSRAHEEDADPTDQEGARAVLLIYEGNYPEAIKAMEKFESEHPGRYENAANLGTAYELNGDNKSALKWITEGIKRNPDSHDGSEWLHQLILETKIKMESNPDLLKTTRIIPLPENISKNTSIEINGKTYTPAEVFEALKYQLSERMVFVKPSDPIVADLLYSLGILEAHQHVIEYSLPIFTLASDYGFTDDQLLAETTESYQRIIQQRKIKMYSIYFFIAISVITILYFGFKRKKTSISNVDRNRYKEEKVRESLG